MADQPLLGSFTWCELLTTDTSAAAAFYQKVIGWKTGAWPGDPTYTTVAGEAGPVGGMMALPEDALKAAAPPNWMMYLGTPNVVETAMRVVQLGGNVLKQPDTVPGGGRFAVVRDPYGAVFGIYTPAQPQAVKGQPGLGDFSWFELNTVDVEGAWRFYQTLFGWEKTSAMDMGGMGVYQMFGRGGGVPNGGMMKAPPGAPVGWAPYAMVADARAAARRATGLGAQIVHGPMEVPGGDWIAVGIDPQGAMFAVHSRKPAAATKPAAKKAAATRVSKRKSAKKTAATRVGKRKSAKKAAATRVSKKKSAKKTSAKSKTKAAKTKTAKKSKAARTTRKTVKKPTRKVSKK